MKVLTNLREVVPIGDEEAEVGALVRSVVDENATGMIVQFLSGDDVLVLWSTPPKDLHKKFGEIW